LGQVLQELGAAVDNLKTNLKQWGTGFIDLKGLLDVGDKGILLSVNIILRVEDLLALLVATVLKGPSGHLVLEAIFEGCTECRGALLFGYLLINVQKLLIAYILEVGSPEFDLVELFGEVFVVPVLQGLERAIESNFMFISKCRRWTRVIGVKRSIARKELEGDFVVEKGTVV